eukprot:11180233-Lingulodinium_polyedra.AAC.1
MYTDSDARWACTQDVRACKLICIWRGRAQSCVARIVPPHVCGMRGWSLNPTRHGHAALLCVRVCAAIAFCRAWRRAAPLPVAVYRRECRRQKGVQRLIAAYAGVECAA